MRLRGLDKSFGVTCALRDVDLEIAAGEIHGLVGENGAGKSTLIRCVTGVIRADAGTIELDGRAIEVGSPREAALRNGRRSGHRPALRRL